MVKSIKISVTNLMLGISSNLYPFNLPQITYPINGIHQSKNKGLTNATQSYEAIKAIIAAPVCTVSTNLSLLKLGAKATKNTLLTAIKAKNS